MKKYPVSFAWLGIESRLSHTSGRGNGRARSERKAVTWLIGLTALTAAVFCLPPSAAAGAPVPTEPTAFSVTGADVRPIEAVVPEAEVDPAQPAGFAQPADSVPVRDAGADSWVAAGSAAGAARDGAARGSSAAVRGGSPDAPPETFPVYVCGAVRRPQVLRATAGAVLDDLVRQCGGFTEAADIAAVNLAMAVTPNSRIYIPAAGETPEAGAGSGFDSGGAAGAAGGGSSDSAGRPDTAGALVNLNTADLSQLCGLPGIGERTAARILADRARNGPFAGVEDLMRVPGIKAGKLEALRPLVFVG